VVQIALLILLLLGPVRKYVLLFFFYATRLGANLAEMLVLRTQPVTSSDYRHLYWTDEVLLDLLLFLLVITLTYRVLENSPQREAMRKVLFSVVAVVVVLPFLLFGYPFSAGPWPTGRWFNHTSQLLNFGGAIMNLALWTAIIGNKRRDVQLLLVCLGVGVDVTGAAISYGVNLLLPQDARWFSNGFLSLTNVVSVIILCWAFRPPSRATHPVNAVTAP